MFIEAKDNGGGGDSWSYRLCKAPVKSSPPTNQHPVICQSTEGKNINNINETDINRSGRKKL